MTAEKPDIIACWSRLIALHGPLTLLDDLSPDEQRKALTEARVLHIEAKSDGFGSGYVSIKIPTPGIAGPPRNVQDHLTTVGFVVFVTPFVLTELERGYLGNEWANPWERWSEVPGLPDPPPRRVTTDLISTLFRVCPGYIAALKTCVPYNNTIEFHELMLARVAAEEIKQGRGEGLRAAFLAVDQLYPTQPSIDGRHKGPRGLMDTLLAHLIADGVDIKQVEGLLPQGLHYCWAIAQEDRFCPPHDPYW